MAVTQLVARILRKRAALFVRIAEATSLQRAVGFNAVKVKKFFDELKGYFTTAMKNKLFDRPEHESPTDGVHRGRMQSRHRSKRS